MKSDKNVYQDTDIRVACYMTYLENKWIQKASETITIKHSKSLSRDVTETPAVYGIYAVLDKEGALHKRKIMLET